MRPEPRILAARHDEPPPAGAASAFAVVFALGFAVTLVAYALVLA